MQLCRKEKWVAVVAGDQSVSEMSAKTLNLMYFKTLKCLESNCVNR